MHRSLVHLVRPALWSLLIERILQNLVTASSAGAVASLVPMGSVLALVHLSFIFAAFPLSFPFLTRVGSGTHVGRLYASSPSAQRSHYLLYRCSHRSMLRNRDLLPHFDIEGSLCNTLDHHYLTTPLLSLYKVGGNLSSDLNHITQVTLKGLTPTLSRVSNANGLCPVLGLNMSSDAFWAQHRTQTNHKPIPEGPQRGATWPR